MRRAPPPGAPLPGPQGGAAQRGERERGARAACPARLPTQRRGAGQTSRTQPGRAAAAGPSADAGSPAATWTRVRRPRAPRPRAGPRPGQPTPPRPRPCLLLLAPSPPTLTPGLAWGVRGRRERHLHHGSGDDPGHHLPGGLDPTSGAGGRRAWRTRPPTAGRALAGFSRSPGPRWRPRELGPVSARGGPSCAAVGPPPVPARRRSRRRASQPRPCAPLIGGGGGGALAEARSGLLGSGGWAPGAGLAVPRPAPDGVVARISGLSLPSSCSFCPWAVHLAWGGGAWWGGGGG